MYRSIVVITVLISFFYGCTIPHQGSISESNTLYANQISPKPDHALTDRPDAHLQHTVPHEMNMQTDEDSETEITEEQTGGIVQSDKDIIPEHAGEDVISDEDIINNVLLCYELSQEYWRNGEIDNAVDALDHAFSQILTFDPQNNESLDQMKEDLRVMISKRIVEIYASKNTAVTGKHNAIPVVMNKYVEEQIRVLGVSKNSQREGFFRQAYRRSGKYRPFIVEELKKAGLPEELSWLPLIESGYNVNALSNARALGLWQFISSTGHRFGLKRDKFIDERLDPVKSTKAAVAYLKELHKIFGDWSTAIASYNCGEHLVLSVIKKQKVNYLDHFWDLYERLPNETAQFFPRFIATLHIVKNPEEYGLDDIEVDQPLEYDTLVVSKQVHLQEIAKHIGVSEQLLYDLNPELRYRIIPDASYTLRIPPNTKDLMVAYLDRMPVSPLPSGSEIKTGSKPKPNSGVSIIRHKVRKGETLSAIANKYGVSVSQIVQANNKKKKNVIIAGEQLKIPVAKGYVASKSNAKNAKYARTHVVRNGDTLWTIAQRYGTTPKEIMKINNLSKNSLRIGQVLKIPVPIVEIPKDKRNYSLFSGEKELIIFS